METDNMENQVIQGNLTILSDNSFGNGSLGLQGTLYSDIIMSNTIGRSVNIESIKILNGNITIPQQSNLPNLPNGTDNILFLNTNNLLSSINSSGILTTFQPINTKGDLQTHNGTTQVKLPVGSDNSILVADSTQPFGLKWTTNITNDQPLPIFTLTSSNTNTAIIDNTYGSYTSNIYNNVKQGSSGNFFFSKSNPSIVGNYTQLSGNPSTLTLGHLNSQWDNYSQAYIYKDYIEANGDYVSNPSTSFTPQEIVTLSGTNVSTFTSSSTTGAFIYNVYPQQNGGPTSTFIVVKNNPNYSSGNITKINSSPSINPTDTLNFGWPSNSQPTLSKNTSSFNGGYVVVNVFQNVNYITSVNLTDTTISIIDTTFFPYFTCKSFFVSVKSNMSGSPMAIFSISKNSASLNGSISSFVSNGVTTNERLNLTWNTNSNLMISKSGSNYNALYTLTFTKFS